MTRRLLTPVSQDECEGVHESEQPPQQISLDEQYAAELEQLQLHNASAFDGSCPPDESSIYGYPTAAQPDAMTRSVFQYGYAHNTPEHTSPYNHNAGFHGVSFGLPVHHPIHLPLSLLTQVRIS
jgi:hypothetical protein